MNDIDIEKILSKCKNKFQLVKVLSIRTRQMLINDKKKLSRIYIDKPFITILKDFEKENKNTNN